MQQPLTCVEICAGAGGQALGLAMAGFVHVALVEYEEDYCKVLKQNRPEWNVICADVHDFDGRPYHGVDLLAGGVPCPPFSVAGKQLGQEDERDLFPEAIRLIKEIQPRAVMLENVRGFLDPGFDEYRNHIFTSIQKLGYVTHIKLLNASDYGVPQLRPRVVIIGIRKDQIGAFAYPDERPDSALTVGNTLRDLMAQNGWEGAKQWASNANRIAPTLVGGSKKHGGPDLGPTRARNAWAELGVDGRGIANEAPAPGFEGMPRLTSRMMARIQGFPDTWTFGNRKTVACRMIGNAFPPRLPGQLEKELRSVWNMDALIANARFHFHKRLFETNTLTLTTAGVASNADTSSRGSKAIARRIVDILVEEQRHAVSTVDKISGQTLGKQFETLTMEFLRETFPYLQNLRPGNWTILQLGNNNKLKTSDFAQYEHLAYLNALTTQNAQLAAALGNDYLVAPDVVVYRDLYEDSEINAAQPIVDDEICKMADIRKSNGGKPILHASVSAKYTMRSDRAQNSRTEALNLIRNRKGHLPHIVVVTAEPMPNRLASLALGTGDIDCVYHFALYELIRAVKEAGSEDAVETLETLVQGKRLKDISDLPLDLSV